MLKMWVLNQRKLLCLSLIAVHGKNQLQLPLVSLELKEVCIPLVWGHYSVEVWENSEQSFIDERGFTF